jgi:hypothetical protein
MAISDISGSAMKNATVDLRCIVLRRLEGRRIAACLGASIAASTMVGLIYLV